MNAHNDFDPFTALAVGDVPVAPDADFARRLRIRLERGLDLPEGVTMTTDALPETSTAATSVAVERPGALPYLTVADPAAAIDWYVAHLGAELRGEPILMDDGSIGHAELLIGGGVIYLAGEFAELGLKGPAPQSVSVSLMLAVPDTDSALRSARDGGAEVQREPYDAHGTRTGVMVDPFGHRWMLTGPVSAESVKDDSPEQIRRGDLGYCSLWTTDVDRAVAFYGSVLGWQFDAATGQVTNLSQRLGIYGVQSGQGMLCAYAVDDIDRARTDIVAAGGTPNELQRFPFGELLDAVDNQGVAFAVYRPTVDDPRPPLNATGHGELTYMTHYTPDSALLREFYGSVLGWTFSGGRMDDGWEVENNHPMTGIAGGQTGSVAVPMWVVDDIEVAVQRVRDGGGTVISGPEQQSYAISAECLDDQGAHFYLGQY
ncbi:MAG: glyoxalase [Gordonia sp.]|nr:glyoxalase [Gordonia sp. (in: high G+C Gram-positive bacteria)]